MQEVIEGTRISKWQWRETRTITRPELQLTWLKLFSLLAIVVENSLNLRLTPKETRNNWNCIDIGDIGEPMRLGCGPTIFLRVLFAKNIYLYFIKVILSKINWFYWQIYTGIQPLAYQRENTWNNKINFYNSGKVPAYIWACLMFIFDTL
jgi:hypothetical protein